MYHPNPRADPEAVGPPAPAGPPERGPARPTTPSGWVCSFTGGPGLWPRGLSGLEVPPLLLLTPAKPPVHDALWYRVDTSADLRRVVSAEGVVILMLAPTAAPDRYSGSVSNLHTGSALGIILAISLYSSGTDK